jgi:hypothetical protein
MPSPLKYPRSTAHTLDWKSRIEKYLHRKYDRTPIGPHDIIRIVSISYSVVLLGGGGLFSPPARSWGLFKGPISEDFNCGKIDRFILSINSFFALTTSKIVIAIHIILKKYLKMLKSI